MDMQAALDAILNETPTEVEFGGRKVKVGWMRYGVERRFTHVVMTEGDMQKQLCKCVALVLLGKYWKVRLFYWAYWRWLYWRGEMVAADAVRVLDAAKKKVMLQPCLAATMLAIGMTDLAMTIKKAEASVFPAARLGGRPTH